ncbi:unnamed protein product [Ilex paraguariensis]|uniref:Uncharacterized protein n=1 Tax=Ilex paraguariensis TaxID=185542 RepID=A0ABC8S1R2_9AQUA
MSTTPIPVPEQQQPPPIAETTQQAYTAHSGHGSVGPVIAVLAVITILVLAVITILGAIAIVIGRLCSGRRIMGRGRYDFEGWVETKFSSCLDGRVDPPPPRAAAENSFSGGGGFGDAVPAAENRVSSGSGNAVPAETPQQAKEEEMISDRRNPHETAQSS